MSYKRDEKCEFVPKPILLFCGRGSVGNTETNNTGEEIRLAHVTVDTCGIKDPFIIKIEFSNNIKYEERDVADMISRVRIRYNLFRQCGSEAADLLDTWVYERDIRLNDPDDHIDTTDIISFHYCNCEITCKDCCDYFVTATAVDLNNAKVNYIKAEMSALVQELCKVKRKTPYNYIDY